jgi:cytochrome c oxidase subunit 4
MSASESHELPGMKLYVGVWVGLLFIVALQVFLTYRNLPTKTLVASLLLLSAVEAGLALMYFMHLKYERPRLFWSLIPTLIFVLFMMDHIWPDALRLIKLRLPTP